MSGSSPSVHPSEGETDLFDLRLRRAVFGFVLLMVVLFFPIQREFGRHGDYRQFVTYLLSNRIYFQKNGPFHLPYYNFGSVSLLS